MRTLEQDVRNGSKIITVTLNIDGSVRHGDGDKVQVVKTATGGFAVYALGFKALKSVSGSAFGNIGIIVTNISQPNVVSVAMYSMASALTDNYCTLVINGLTR